MPDAVQHVPLQIAWAMKLHRIGRWCYVVHAELNSSQERAIFSVVFFA